MGEEQKRIDPEDVGVSGVDAAGNEVVPDETQTTDGDGNLVLDASHPDNVAPQEGRVPGQVDPVHAPNTGEGNNPLPEQGGYPLSSPAAEGAYDVTGPRGPQTLTGQPDTTPATEEDN